MSVWKKFLGVLSVAGFAAASAYAAVTPIVDTPYSSAFGRSVGGIESNSGLSDEEDTSHTSTFTENGNPECGPAALDNRTYSVQQCATALKTDVSKVSFEPCGDGTKSNCLYLETCSVVSGKAEAVSGTTTAELTTSLNNIAAKYTDVDNNQGTPVAYCSENNTPYVYYGCDASYTASEEPQCASGMSALSCNLNGSPRWKCDYKFCTSEELNKTVGDSYTMPQEILATVEESGRCYENMSSGGKKLRTIYACKSEYAYTLENCVAQNNDNYSVADVCLWGGAYRSGQDTLIADFDMLYRHCRPQCPDGITESSTFCTSGDVLETCVLPGADMQSNTLLDYCGCEQNEQGQDLYYSPDDCTGGKVVGGRTCTSLIDQSTKYELCLPICSSLSGKTYKDSYAACIRELNLTSLPSTQTETMSVMTRAAVSLDEYKRRPINGQCCREADGETYDCVSEPFVIDSDGTCYPDVTRYCTNAYINKSACDDNVQFCCQYNSSDEVMTSTCLSKGNFVTDPQTGTCWAGTPLDDSFDYCTTTDGKKDPSCSSDLTVKCCSFVGASTITTDAACSENFILNKEEGGCVKISSAEDLDNVCLGREFDEKVSYVCSCPADKGYESSCADDEIAFNTCSYDGADKYICISGCTEEDIAAGYVKDNIDDCKLESTDTPSAEICYLQDGSSKQRCHCPENYKICPENGGIGTACMYDGFAKYAQCAGEGQSILCDETRPLYDSPSSCPFSYTDASQMSVSAPTPTECYWNGQKKYMCNCPADFSEICGTGTIGAGDGCRYKTDVVYYSLCATACRTSTTQQPVVENSEDCAPIDGKAAQTTACIDGGSIKYECHCPTGFKTSPGVGYIGLGTACYYDGTEPKYQDYGLGCPDDRPLFYTADACAFSGIKGENVQSCYLNNVESEDNLRYYCDCPQGYRNDSECAALNADYEGAGIMCQLEGSTAAQTKYQYCYAKCDRMPGASTNNGVFMEDDLADSRSCLWELGQGATYEACSDNHQIKNKCYCGSAYDSRLTCLPEDDLSPDVDASKPACSINGVVYYQSCKPRACDETALLATSQSECAQMLGTAATYTACTMEGDNRTFYECRCDTSAYSEVCRYPEVEPTASPYCYSSKYDAASNPNPEKQYRPGLCRVGTLEKCRSDGEIIGNYVYTVTSTESECRQKFGDAAQSRLCEDPDDPDIRRFNCFYNRDEYKYTAANCPVRHILGGGSIVINGVRYYKECNCHPAYKAHRYNCAGILSGGGCEQEVTAENNDGTIPDGVTTLKFYPYCSCPEDYNQVCDGERNIGVGEPCNGKYKACECKPDEIPENWTDNYYGCPGGAKPTGVTKPDGCGGKYYQCEASQCTWEHNKQCTGDYQIGVDGCQDNQGNIYAYKSCKCPDGWQKCEGTLVGEGNPCSLDGENYYKSCTAINECQKGEYLTCNGPLQVGINACTKNDKIYFEKCGCASGYNKKCENGETGVGSACIIDGVSYYQSCTAPEMTCTDEHQTACADNQEKYDPCVSEDGSMKYKCRCPSNFTTCSATAPAEGATSCYDSEKGTLYSACTSTETCTTDEEKIYKVCTPQQLGMGRSCTDSTGVVRYAECQDTTDCKTNGYKYTCSGYVASGLEDDFCIDENGTKLYKSCTCPSSYVTCPDNNVKGTPCTPLNEDGSYGTTVYSSCVCSSQYSETCDGNGQTPANPDDSCGTADENGNVITKYKSCKCSEEFNKTCVDSGFIPTDSNEICQEVTYVGSQRVVTEKYRSCGCGDDYKYACDGSDDGDSSENAAKYTTSGGCTKVIDNQEVTLYKACSCNPTYSTTTCQYGVIPGSDFCLSINADGSRTTYYTNAACEEEPECEPTSCSGYDLTSYDSCLCSSNANVCNPGCGEPSKYQCKENTTGNKSDYPFTKANCDNNSSYNGKYEARNGIESCGMYQECVCKSEYQYVDGDSSSCERSSGSGVQCIKITIKEEEQTIEEDDGTQTTKKVPYVQKTTVSCRGYLVGDENNRCRDLNKSMSETGEYKYKSCVCDGVVDEWSNDTYDVHKDWSVGDEFIYCKKSGDAVWTNRIDI